MERVQIQFTPQQIAQLDAWQRRLSMASRSELVRQIVREWMASQPIEPDDDPIIIDEVTQP